MDGYFLHRRNFGRMIALALLPIEVFLVLAVVGFVLAFYKALGEVSDKDNE